jgi:hypothetical protein
MKLPALILLTAVTTILPVSGALPSSATLDSFARDLIDTESVRAIKNTQRLYAQLHQFGLYSNISSLFTTNATFIHGNITIHGGPSAISSWLSTDAGSMNGITPGSLDTTIVENPVISLSVDGKSGKGRWNGLRFQGDGQGRVRIRGGIYENEYVLTSQGWKISVLHYHALYEGDGEYKNGWRNVEGKGLPIVPYHFTPEGSGIPIPSSPEGAAPHTGLSVEEVTKRIQRLNYEDEVRNLMHAHGYYVDRRMWRDVVDLHTEDTTVVIRGESARNYTGLSGVREALQRMGPEDLTQGVNNDHPYFDMIVQVSNDGKEAVARGIEIAMIGNAGNKTARWEFNTFRNRLVKDKGVWKVKTVDITPLVVADYYKGWGYGGLKAPNTHVPDFVNLATPMYNGFRREFGRRSNFTNLADLRRRLSRSAAYDGAENQSAAYGYFLDDLDCAQMGALFAKRGHKASPFAGFFITPERVTQACFTSYGTNRSALRSSISFHWRPQPVVLVSEDGRSATLRARLLQPSTSTSKAGSFNGAMYHDQMVLEDGKWRLWSVTIDEFYWQSSSWEGGWSAATPRNSSAPNPGGATWTKRYPPDITIEGVGERESTFRGGSGKFIEWPDIQRMWFQYRNPVSGRVPEWYWPGCVPCKAMPDWALERNGYQEPVDWPWLRNGNGTLVRYVR